MGNETATNVHFDTPMQDITERLEAHMYGEPEGQIEPETTDDDEVPTDVILSRDDLPKDDDSDADEEEGSDLELDDIADADDELSLAEYLGVDESRITTDEEGNLAVNSIIDGETKPVPLKELVSSYQMQGHTNNKSIALEAERKEFEGIRNQVSGDLKSKLDEVDSMNKMLEQKLVGEYSNIDWDRLRHENPSEWSALRQEFAEQAQSIKDSRAKSKQVADELMSEAMAKQQQQMSSHIADQTAKIIAANPTWSDPDTMKAAQEKLRSFMGEAYGFTEDDMKTIVDHRLVAMIQDAHTYREGKKAVEAKKDKRVPKFRKPGAAKANANQLAKARKVKANKKAIKASNGSTRSIADSILDRM